MMDVGTQKVLEQSCPSICASYETGTASPLISRNLPDKQYCTHLAPPSGEVFQSVIYYYKMNTRKPLIQGNYNRSKRVKAFAVVVGCSFLTV
jgi:hypothetical protein